MCTMSRYYRKRGSHFLKIKKNIADNTWNQIIQICLIYPNEGSYHSYHTVINKKLATLSQKEKKWSVDITSSLTIKRLKLTF